MTEWNTFWHSLLWSFITFGVAVLYVVLEYWPQILLLVLIYTGVKLVVKGRRPV